ncbi:MAG: hypothetical protein IJP48_10455 [Synergistaceae bacterium]|nr:hypothetical protein [Synergistaceae bacterium]
MPGKKFLVVIACVLILACSCAVSAEGLKIGLLNRSVTEELFNKNVASSWLWTVLRNNHSKHDKFIFYDDLSSMLLALNKGEIDEIDTVKIVAEYITAQNPDYEISCVMKTDPISFVFGFLKHRL